MFQDNAVVRAEWYRRQYHQFSLCALLPPGMVGGVRYGGWDQTNPLDIYYPQVWWVGSGMAGGSDQPTRYWL